MPRIPWRPYWNSWDMNCFLLDFKIQFCMLAGACGTFETLVFVCTGSSHVWPQMKRNRVNVIEGTFLWNPVEVRTSFSFKVCPGAPLPTVWNHFLIKNDFTAGLISSTHVPKNIPAWDRRVVPQGGLSDAILKRYTHGRLFNADQRILKFQMSLVYSRWISDKQNRNLADTQLNKFTHFMYHNILSCFLCDKSQTWVKNPVWFSVYRQ